MCQSLKSKEIPAPEWWPKDIDPNEFFDQLPPEKYGHWLSFFQLDYFTNPEVRPTMEIRFNEFRTKKAKKS